MRKLDFDIITLGHGSGGLLTNRLLDAGVFDLLNNEHLENRTDGAILNLNGKTAFSTDSFVVSPLSFPGGNIGDLAVNGTVNDLAMCGAVPKYISLSFIIEEGLRMEEFWEVLISIKFACEKAKVKVVTGDTKVVEKGKGDKIYINTTGIGEVLPDADIAPSNIKEGDVVIVSDTIANHGMAIMSVRQGLEFESTIESDTKNLNQEVAELINSFGHKIHALSDPTRGGVATVLNEYAQKVALGVDLVEHQIPVEQQVASACELLGLDPLYVANEGVFLAIVDASIGDEVIQKLKEYNPNSTPTIIGNFTTQHPKKVVMNSAIGGKRVIGMLPGEQLPRIC